MGGGGGGGGAGAGAGAGGGVVVVGACMVAVVRWRWGGGGGLLLPGMHPYNVTTNGTVDVTRPDHGKINMMPYDTRIQSTVQKQK